jgi:hypothetical protein
MQYAYGDAVRLSSKQRDHLMCVYLPILRFPGHGFVPTHTHDQRLLVFECQIMASVCAYTIK